MPQNLFEQTVAGVLHRGRLIRAVFSGPLHSDIPHRITIRPITLKSGDAFQFESFLGKQAYHRNVTADDLAAEFSRHWHEGYQQLMVYTTELDAQITAKKSGHVRLHESAPTHQATATSHDRQKIRPLVDGEPVVFLHRLGMTAADGRVLAAKQAKFRQINRFLEIVTDASKLFEAKETVNVVDFGCGKGYLTFALHHFLTESLGKRTAMVGVDANPAVVKTCAGLVDDLRLKGLQFHQSDIASYEVGPMDMVVALHACDTATDDALLKAVKAGASVILTAPCCQHELLGQLKSEPLTGMLKFGLVKERLSSLVTDSLRCLWLESKGYCVDMVEFVDPEHTPKNILLRAVFRGEETRAVTAQRDYDQLRHFWGVTSRLDLATREVSSVLPN